MDLSTLIDEYNVCTIILSTLIRLKNRNLSEWFGQSDILKTYVTVSKEKSLNNPITKETSVEKICIKALIWIMVPYIQPTFHYHLFSKNFHP